MSTLTYCRLVSRKYLILNRRTIVRCLVWFSFITSILILHLWIEFRIRDLKIQTQILQHYQLRLLDYNKGLRSHVYELEKDDRLRELARTQLHMQDTNPSELEYMTIPASLLAKYKAIDVGIEIADRFWSEMTVNEDRHILEETILNLARFSVAEQTEDH